MTAGRLHLAQQERFRCIPTGVLNMPFPAVLPYRRCQRAERCRDECAGFAGRPHLDSCLTSSRYRIVR